MNEYRHVFSTISSSSTDGLPEVKPIPCAESLIEMTTDDSHGLPTSECFHTLVSLKFYHH